MTTNVDDPNDLKIGEPEVVEWDDSLEIRPSKHGRLEGVHSKIVGFASVAAVFIAWELVSTVGKFSTLVLPTPADVIDTFHKYIGSGQIWTDLSTSGKEFLYGYLIAALIGVFVGLLTGWYKVARYVVAPYVWFFLSVPIIALTPLIIIWAGIGLEAKIIIVAMSGFFPIMVNTMTGVQGVDPKLLRLERTYCATDFQTFRTLILPSAFPYIMTGLRLGIGHAIIGIYVGELEGGASAGIGFMMSNAGNIGNTPLVFVGLFILGCTGIVFTLIVGLLQRLQHGEVIDQFK